MTNDGGADCAICLDPIDESAHRLGCGHAFHPWCILHAWRESPRDMTCPMCRRKAHQRMAVSLVDIDETIKKHTHWTRTIIDTWFMVGWIVAFASAFWYCTFVFGEINSLATGWQYVFTIFAVLLTVVLRPNKTAYPVLRGDRAE